MLQGWIYDDTVQMTLESSLEVGGTLEKLALQCLLC